MSFAHGQIQILLDCNSGGLNCPAEAWSLLPHNIDEAIVTILLFGYRCKVTKEEFELY